MPVLDPRNETIWDIFQHLCSQARVGGLGGFVGFDYGVLEFLLRAYSIPEGEWFLYLDNIRALSEVAAKYWQPDEDEKK